MTWPVPATTFACGHPDEHGGGWGLCPSCVAERDRFHTNAARMLELVATFQPTKLLQFIAQEYGPFVQYGPKRKFIKITDPARARWLEARSAERRAKRGKTRSLRSWPRLPLTRVWPRIRRAVDQYQRATEVVEEGAQDGRVREAAGELMVDAYLSVMRALHELDACDAVKSRILWMVTTP